MEYRLLNVYDTYVPAHIDMGRLKEEDIDCWLRDENTVTINPILGNAIGGIKLMVAASDFEKAKGILLTLQKAYKESLACPHCHSHNIEWVTSSRKPVNLIGAISSWLLGNYSMAEKCYHCFDCNREFQEAETTAQHDMN